MTKDLRAFMRESAKTEEVITAPGVPSILGDDGEPIPLEIKVLSAAKIREITDNCEKKAMACNNKGVPYVFNGEVAYSVDKHSATAANLIIVEALVFPDLKDKELMAFFNCHSHAEMPDKVFPRTEEYNHVSRQVSLALGLTAVDTESDEITEIKN